MGEGRVLEEIIGWTGNLFILASSVILLKRTTKAYPVLLVIGNALYAVQAVMLGNASLLFLCITVGTINLMAVLTWKK